MGAETLIASAALILAVLALVRSSRRASSAPPQHPATSTDRAGASPGTYDRLVATVRALELQVSDHETLLCSLVTEDEARHLWNIAKDESTLYERHPGVESELRALVRRGLVRKRGTFLIHELAPRFDIREHFELTSSGHLLLGLRKHLEGADRRPAESLPPEASSTSGPSRGDGPFREAPQDTSHP